MDEPKNLILKILGEKSALKQHVFDRTLDAFNLLKKTLQQIEVEYNQSLADIDKRVRLVYKDRSKFECQLRIAGDLLIFSMHSNVFEFDRDHSIWKTSYIEQNRLNSYCGVINVYNFLNDSFEYNRFDDEGYLIARIFVNHESHYFVEGKRQLGYLYNSFGSAILTGADLLNIVNSAILYTLEFDLLVPPYDTAKLVSVGQLNEKIESSRLQTGKRLGFKFNADDISVP
jgi:hypothetical protein